MATQLDTMMGSFTSTVEKVGIPQYAEECAIGVWTDDLGNPGITAVVFQNQLYALVIPDSYTYMSGSMLSDAVNGTVYNAFVAWEDDRRRLIKEAMR